MVSLWLTLQSIKVLSLVVCCSALQLKKSIEEVKDIHDINNIPIKMFGFNGNSEMFKRENKQSDKKFVKEFESQLFKKSINNWLTHLLKHRQEEKKVSSNKRKEVINEMRRKAIPLSFNRFGLNDQLKYPYASSIVEANNEPFGTWSSLSQRLPHNMEKNFKPFLSNGIVNFRKEETENPLYGRRYGKEMQENQAEDELITKEVPPLNRRFGKEIIDQPFGRFGKEKFDQPIGRFGKEIAEEDYPDRRYGKEIALKDVSIRSFGEKNLLDAPKPSRRYGKELHEMFPSTTKYLRSQRKEEKSYGDELVPDIPFKRMLPSQEKKKEIFMEIPVSKHVLQHQGKNKRSVLKMHRSENTNKQVIDIELSPYMRRYGK